MSLARFRKPVVLASEEDDVVSIAKKMREASVGCVVVIRGSRPVGIITDRDLALRVIADGRDAKGTRACEIVTYDPIVLSEDDGVETAAARMREHGIRRLPLVDARGEVTGIVTADDLFVMLSRELADLGQSVAESADESESR